jgi:hypothetical protein
MLAASTDRPIVLRSLCYNRGTMKWLVNLACYIGQPYITHSRNPRCSFCRRRRREAGPLVEAPNRVFICEQCIELCRSIMEQEKARIAASQVPADAAAAPPISN